MTKAKPDKSKLDSINCIGMYLMIIVAIIFAPAALPLLLGVAFGGGSGVC